MLHVTVPPEAESEWEPDGDALPENVPVVEALKDGGSPLERDG